AWYGIHDPIDFHTFERGFKIIAPEMSPIICFAPDTERFWTLETCSVVNPHPELDVKYLLGLLNSNVLTFSGKHLAPLFSGRYYQYKTIYLKQFPIKLPESPQEKKLADEVIDLVGQILDLIKLQQDSERDLSSRTERTDNARLDDYPSIIFNISSNKIVQIRREGSRVLLNLTDYIECKDDFVARYVELCLKFSEAKLTYSNDLRRDIGQVRIPKDKQLVHRLVKRHDEEQKEIEGIPERVKNLERDIDQRVYTLYKLSKDDIDLIEETIA